MQWKTNTHYFECAICAKKIASSYNLWRHLRSVHENIKNFECHICAKQFGSNFNLHQHLKTVHKNAKVVHGDVQNFKNSVGVIQFEKKNVATALHRQVNFDIECRLCINQIDCSIMFKDKSELEQHLQLNHNNKPKKLMFKCSFETSPIPIEEDVHNFEDSVDATHFEEKNAVSQQPSSLLSYQVCQKI